MSWFKRKPEIPAMDHAALMREAGELRDRIYEIHDQAQIACGELDIKQLKALKAEADVALERMKEIARELGIAA